MNRTAILILSFWTFSGACPGFAQKMESLVNEEASRKHREAAGLVMLEEKNASGATVTIEEYDSQGRVIHRLHRHKLGMSYGQGLLPDDMAVNEWHFRYDSNGNVIEARNAHQTVKGTVHGKGEPFALPYIGPPFKVDTFRQVLTWEYTYDKKGRKIGEIGHFLPPARLFHQTNSYGNILLTPKSRFSYSYNKDGRLIQEEEWRTDIPGGPLFTRHYTYDAQGRLIGETEHSGKNLVNRFSYSYNAKGQLAEKHAHGYRFVFLYDDQSNLAEMNKYYTLNNNLVHRQEFTWDSRGTCTSEIYSVQIESHDQKNSQWKTSYDKKGRLKKRLLQLPNGQNGQEGFFYTYNE
jgi:YD repeat-containing protein